MKYYSIAIDGPSGAGKSTLARALAQEMGYLYVDTGAIYRTVGLAVQRRGVDPSDPQAVEQVLGQVDITMGHGEDGQQRMYLDGEDVSQAIRQHVISGYASKVAALAPVRAFLLNKQRHLADNHNVIMDGRDIGTVVLPQADVKIFLTASVEDRARRRWEELRERGTPKDFDELLAEIRQRDHNDESRAAAPLRAAEDAVRLDTTGNTFEESRRQILKIIKERLGR